MSKAAEAFTRLGSSTVLQREKAIRDVELHLSDPTEVSHFLDTISLRASWSKSNAWEERLGYMLASKIAMKHSRQAEFAESSISSSLSLLMDPETRVRAACGDCLGQAASILGAKAWNLTEKPILDVINYCWDRDALAAPDRMPGSPKKEADSEGFVFDLLQHSYRAHKPGLGEMRHGTEGWHALETSVLALRKVVDGIGPAFSKLVSAELLGLLYKAARHPNRFIRETSYHTLASICSVSKGSALKGFGRELATCLQDGLSENWSQVRYAACVCARSFLQAAEGFEAEYYPLILPHLCFNRYDVAEGVRSYSLETWKLILKSHGPQQVARHINEVVSYYVRCAKTNNHTVREAACNCIAELFAKIEKPSVRPHLERLQRTLYRCLKDDSWTVRDAASMAYAKAALAFPEGCRAAVEDIYPLWFNLLDDNVFSVREHTAAALCDIIQAYRQAALDKIMPVLRSNLSRARDQSTDTGGKSSQASNPEKLHTDGIATSKGPSRVESSAQTIQGPSDRDRQIAVAGLPIPTAATAFPDRVRSSRGANDQSAQPDNLFKEGSLLRAKPKDTGGVDYSCGCMDYGFKREKQPWEASDGAVYLLAGLCEIYPQEAGLLLPTLAEIALLDHWPQAHSLQTTIWTQLPLILKALGKRAFKTYLEAFLVPLFRSLVCENQLCRAAAGRCLAAIRDCLGPGIFAGRLDDRQKTLMDKSPEVPPLAGRYAPAASRLGGQRQLVN